MNPFQLVISLFSISKEESTTKDVSRSYLVAGIVKRLFRTMANPTPGIGKSTEDNVIICVIRFKHGFGGDIVSIFVA